MNPEEKVKILVNEFHYVESIARVFVEYGCICPYCGEDLLSSRASYSSIYIDHLLPKSKYPDLEWDQRNLVACCSSCNLMKQELNVLDLYKDIDPKNALDNKQDLINKVKASLFERFEYRQKEYTRVTQIIRSS
jgi:5-methylcytosine-specific restriction endonuclease McrA